MRPNGAQRNSPLGSGPIAGAAAIAVAATESPIRIASRPSRVGTPAPAVSAMARAASKAVSSMPRRVPWHRVLLRQFELALQSAAGDSHPLLGLGTLWNE